MIPFTFEVSKTLLDAAGRTEAVDVSPLAGGTTLLDLMKINVLRPTALISIGPALSREIALTEGGLSIGAGAIMADVADHDDVRSQFPAIRHALILAASPQIRNMATLGGNLLQRTRCPYFRHPEWRCNRREPGTGCDAREPGADVSWTAILGTSDHCVAKYAGDFANVAVAFDAKLDLIGPAGKRTIPARELHRQPGDSPEIETTLKPGELIAAIVFPKTAAAANSLYLKVRERSSYAFALASAAVGLELDGKGPAATIKTARIALGGVGTVPWHSPEAEAALTGKPASDETFAAAADAALKAAQPLPGNAYKVPLAKRTLIRALTMLRDSGVPSDEDLWSFQHGRQT